jgi:hypothetical protein
MKSQNSLVPGNLLPSADQLGREKKEAGAALDARRAVTADQR